MDTTTKKRTATIDTVERLQNTLNGNPQYLIQFTFSHLRRWSR